MNDYFKIKEGDVVRMTYINRCADREMGIVVHTRADDQIHAVVWSESGIVENWSKNALEFINEKY